MSRAVDVVTLRPMAAPLSARHARWATRERVFAVLSTLALLATWELLARAGVLDVRVVSTPTAVGGVMWRLLADGELVAHAGQTLLRLAAGMLAGTAPGLLIGLTMGLFRSPRAVLNPLVSAMYPLPRVALFPVVLLIVGLNEAANVLMIALGPFFTMLIGTMAAVRNVEPIYLRVAKSFGVNTRDLYWKVVFPAALPIILSSFRLSLGLGLLGVVAVEFLVASNGLGYLIWHSWQILSLGQSMVALVVAGLLSYLLFLGLDAAEKRLIPWTAR